MYTRHQPAHSGKAAVSLGPSCMPEPAARSKQLACSDRLQHVALYCGLYSRTHTIAQRAAGMVSSSSDKHNTVCCLQVQLLPCRCVTDGKQTPQSGPCHPVAAHPAGPEQSQAASLRLTSRSYPTARVLTLPVRERREANTTKRFLSSSGSVSSRATAAATPAALASARSGVLSTHALASAAAASAVSECALHSGCVSIHSQTPQLRLCDCYCMGCVAATPAA